MKSTRSKKPFIENAFCLCSKCNHFVILSKNSFFSTYENSPGSTQNNTNKNTTNSDNNQVYHFQFNHKFNSTAIINLYYNPNEWIYLKFYKKVLKNITYFNFASFPLCPSCSTRLLIQIKMQISSIENTKHLFHFFPEHISLKVIESSIQNLRDGTSHVKLKEKSDANGLKTTKDSLIEYKKNVKEYYKINDTFILSSKYPTYPSQSKSHFSLTLISAFWISTDKHYITINDARIGFYGFRINTIEENNQGLQFLSHLIWAFSETFCIKFRNFEILPSGFIRTKQNKLLPLKIPEQNHSNDIPIFNATLDILFYAASVLFTSHDVSDFCGIPPFAIDVENHTIDSISYIFGESAKSLESWSTAMRLLLFNLKVLQVRSSSQFLSNC